MVITSVNNEKIKEMVKLHDKKNRDNTNLFIIEGEHLVNEALKYHLVTTTFVVEGYQFAFDIDTYEVSDNVMHKLSNNKSIPKILGICHKQEPREIKGNVLILDDIGDPGNLGTIIRSGVAFNIDTIIISPNSVDLYNEKVIRSTQGNIFHINIIRTDLLPIIKDLKQKGYTIIGSDVHDGQDIGNINHNNYALIMGSEGSGISKEVLKSCDVKAKIRMNNKCESLNVGVATGILLYELSRGRL